MATSPSPGLDLAEDSQKEKDLRDELYREFQINEFANTTLPLLVEHFQRKALSQLQDSNPWIATFITSEPSLAEAQKDFLSNGSQCISNLERFTALLRILEGNEFLICRWLRGYVPFISRLYDIRCNNNVELTNPVSEYFKGIEKRKKIEQIRTFELFIQATEPKDSQHPFVQEATAVWWKQSPLDVTHMDSGAWYDLCLQASTNKAQPGGSENVEDAKSLRQRLLQYERTFSEGLARSSPWKLLKGNLHDFAHYIGCPKAYDAPDENIAAMRLFNSTQMPFFQKLQNDLEDQKRINNKQKEIITALVFRHLTENLPPPQYQGHTDSTKRWQAFWTNAIIRENRDKALKTHPLTQVHNYFSDTKRVVGANGQITDQSQEGMKGNLYRAGKELFGTLSTNIHKYGKGGSKDAYIVADDHWGETVRELLRALVPAHFNDDDGEVDWDMERTRYI